MRNINTLRKMLRTFTSVILAACAYALSLSSRIFGKRPVFLVTPFLIGTILIAVSIAELSKLNPQATYRGLRHDIWLTATPNCTIEYPTSYQFFIEPDGPLKFEAFVGFENWDDCSLSLLSRLEIKALTADIIYMGPRGVQETRLIVENEAGEIYYSYDTRMPEDILREAILIRYRGEFMDGIAVRSYHRRAFGLDMLHHKVDNRNVDVQIFVNPRLDINVLSPQSFSYEMYGVSIKGNENIMITLDDLDKVRLKDARLFWIGGLFGTGIAILAEWLIALASRNIKKDN